MPTQGELRIELCGSVALFRDGAPVPLRGRQARVLLAYLVLRRPRPVSRSALAEALWGERLPGAPDVALRALLSKLRVAIDPATVSGGDAVALGLPEDAVVDIDRLT